MVSKLCLALMMAQFAFGMRRIAYLLDHPSKSTCCAEIKFVVSPDGKQIVSVSNDCTISRWDVVSGQLIGSPFNSYTNPVQSIAFSFDGKQMLVIAMAGFTFGTQRTATVDHTSMSTSVGYRPS